MCCHRGHWPKDFGLAGTLWFVRGPVPWDLQVSPSARLQRRIAIEWGGGCFFPPFISRCYGVTGVVGERQDEVLRANVTRGAGTHINTLPRPTRTVPMGSRPQRGLWRIMRRQMCEHGLWKLSLKFESSQIGCYESKRLYANGRWRSWKFW
jgi:hypothetical protein